MNWISDVRRELEKLDTSQKKLKSFGVTVGLIFIAISAWSYFRIKDFTLTKFFLPLGFILLLSGLAFSKILYTPYKIWMGLAFAIGWITSRIILAILFFIIIFPVGTIARLFRKEFLDIDMDKKKDSYWIPKDAKDRYEKMY